MPLLYAKFLSLSCHQPTNKNLTVCSLVFQINLTVSSLEQISLLRNIIKNTYNVCILILYVKILLVHSCTISTYGIDLF